MRMIQNSLTYSMAEEDIVEEFGESFVGGQPSLLRKLLERMLEDDFDFPF